MLMRAVGRAGHLLYRMWYGPLYFLLLLRMYFILKTSGACERIRHTPLVFLLLRM